MEQRFGGAWTATKLAALGDYLGAYTTALKGQRFRLHYVDAFAGSGKFVPSGGTAEERGSALIALETPGFHKFHFIEKGQKRCRHLRELTAGHGPDRVEVLEGDANAHLIELCQKTDWKSSRAVLFLDPYGMQVAWSTLMEVKKTEAIDVWYLFPLSGVTRQMTLNESKMDSDKKRSLDRVFGTNAWRDELYDTDAVPDLFGMTSISRHANTNTIESWITGRLSALFPVVVGPAILRRGHRSRADAGPRLFALYFLASTQSTKGQALARKIANGVLKKLRREAAGR